MFGVIGFWEVMVIAAVGLIVVGPDKFPEIVRTVVRTWRKLHLMISDARRDIEQELDFDEMRKLKDDLNMQKHIDDLNAGILSAEQDGKKLLRDLDFAGIHDGDHDGFSADDASAQADTGEEKPRLSLVKTPKKEEKPS